MEERWLISSIQEFAQIVREVAFPLGKRNRALLKGGIDGPL
jgi:hypothetical protein